MDLIQKELLEEIADLHGVPAGAYNIRANGAAAARNTTANIDIVSKEDKPGIDIIIKPGTKKESVHIPVVISQTGLTDLVYNDFFVGENADVHGAVCLDLVQRAEHVTASSCGRAGSGRRGGCAAATGRKQGGGGNRAQTQQEGTARDLVNFHGNNSFPFFPI